MQHAKDFASARGLGTLALAGIKKDAATLHFGGSMLSNMKVAGKRGGCVWWTMVAK